MHQKVKPRINISKLFKTIDIKPEYLKLIQSGKKKLEFRSWYSEIPYFLLRNTETKNIESVILVGEVIDLNILDEESKETVLDEGGVTEQFREEYDCRYAYVIEKVFMVH